MTIEIQVDIIKKLEHTIKDIRIRAINNVQSKFQSSRTDLQDLDISDVNLLVRNLVKWVDFKPIVHIKQVLEILLALLKSRYQNEVVRALSRHSKRGDLQKMHKSLEDLQSKEFYDEIMQIVNSYRVEFSTKTKEIGTPEPHTSPEHVHSDIYQFVDINANSVTADGMQLEAAWEEAGAQEIQSLTAMRCSLTVKHTQAELDHTLNYFLQCVNDFPGEFFIQSPFIFTNVLELIQCETRDFNYKYALEACLKLTQSLSRRVSVRRLSSMHIAHKKASKKQQVTIGCYCYRTFESVLNLLRHISTDSNLACVNECFLILIEITELICKTAGVYTMAVEMEYRLEEIILKLTDFLKFIRKMTQNYRHNGHKTNRNNSITILFLLCRLIKFRECGPQQEDYQRSHAHDTTDFDLTQKFTHLSLGNIQKFMDQFDSSSSTTIVQSGSETMLDNYVTAMENIDHDLWRRELETALLDYPLKHFYPEIVELITEVLKIGDLPDDNPTKLLLNLAEQLEPVVIMLRDPKMCSPEKILSYSLKSMEVLTLIRSDELTQLIFKSVTSLMPKYNADDELRQNAERLLLNMMSSRCLEMKRLIYKLTSDTITSFFGSLMSGKTYLPKSYASTTPHNWFFGVPMSSEILAEIACNGLSSADQKIEKFAENILTLTLRIEKMLPQRWTDICKVLIPVLPLILCYAKTATQLGSQILSLVEPSSEVELPTIVLIKSNVALLFSRETQIQIEAIYRLIFLFQNIPNAELYMPQMNNMRDTVPNTVCIVEPQQYLSPSGFCNLYESSVMEDLLQVLRSPYTEPSIRHSTLTQLNIVIEDPAVLNCFCEVDGHSTVWNALDNSLREKSTDYYPQNAVQIISILNKVCQRIPNVRRGMEDDIQTYVLVFRSLLLFHTDEKFRRECSALLFSLAYSSFLVGGNKQLIIPTVCRKLAVPIICDFSWKSNLEHQNLFDLIEKSHPNTSDEHSDISCNSSSDDCDMKIPQIWRYLRTAFNALWFGSLDKLTDATNYQEGSRATELNYKLNKDSLGFNRAFCATIIDLEIIEGTSQKFGLNYWVSRLKNVTNNRDVSMSCAAIENFSNTDSDGHRTQWNYKLFQKSISRFCTVMPITREDEIAFGDICHLLSNLIDRDFVDVHIWILEKFSQKNCIYMDLIENPKISTQLFVTNCRFIENVIDKTLKCHSIKIINQLVNASFEDDDKTAAKSKSKQKANNNLYDHLFDVAFKRLNSLFIEKKLDELRCLMSLVRLLTSSRCVVDNEYKATYISNTMIKWMLAIHSMTYVGSRFYKDCLMAISNIMCCVDVLSIDNKHLSFISNLCSHEDFEIRTICWSIQLKIAKEFRGAKLLVQGNKYESLYFSLYTIIEMSGLPGGLYACCLSTMLDSTEVAIVRENAAMLFAALISHRNASNELDQGLYPKSAAGMECEWIGQHMHTHDLIGKIIQSMKCLHVDDVIDRDQNDSNVEIVPCNLMRAYCIIMTQLLPLKGTGNITAIFYAANEISKQIPNIYQSINTSSILLLTEVCTFISQCIVHRKSMVDQIVRDFQVVLALVSFLNVDIMESVPKVAKHACWSKVMKLLRRLCVSPVGFQIICEAFNRNECLEQTVTLLVYGLADRDMSVHTMRFINDMLIVSQTTEYDFITFAELMNGITLSPTVKESIKKFIFSTELISQPLVNWLETSEQGDEVCAADLVYRQLSNLFERFDENNKQLNKDAFFESNCKALESILKCAESARAVATGERFMLAIVEHMEKVYTAVSGSFTEYVRRFGNAKAEKYINKLKLLLHLIMCWYSADCLQDDECIQSLLITSQKFWSTIGIDAELQLIFMKMILFISDDSLPVCKTLSTNQSVAVGSSPFLQCIVEFCVAESGKPKPAKANLETLQLAMKIVTNCCSCIEGRVLLNKIRALQTFSRLHPQVTRNQKPWTQITTFWLKLFEVLTRSSDSSKEAHLNTLCNLAESPIEGNRILSLEILRNMSFNPENRTVLLQSMDLQRVIYNVLDERNIGEEQLLITVTIWKLIANNAKGKNVIKNSQIYGKLRALRDVVDRHTYDKRLRANVDSGNESSTTDDSLEELSVALMHVLQLLTIRY